MIVPNLSIPLCSHFLPKDTQMKKEVDESGCEALTRSSDPAHPEPEPGAFSKLNLHNNRGPKGRTLSRPKFTNVHRLKWRIPFLTTFQAIWVFQEQVLLTSLTINLIRCKFRVRFTYLLRPHIAFGHLPDLGERGQRSQR